MRRPTGQTLRVPTPADPASGVLSRRHKRAIWKQALSIAIAITPFGVAFGVACNEADLGWLVALGYSSLIFTGGGQFAAVSVLGEGGTAGAAILAAVLLNLRSLAYGVAMAPSLKGSLPWRAAVSQLMIDESVAVASPQTGAQARTYGYLAGGLSVFVLWNISTLVGVLAFSSAGDLVTDLGIDATIPAAFLALVWPRLSTNEGRALAAGGAVIALVLVPLVPAGIPIVAAALAVVFARPWRPGDPTSEPLAVTES